MIVESRVFDGTNESFDALVDWAGPQFREHWMIGEGKVSLYRVAVANPGSDMIQWAYPGDTIERHDDGLLVVMPAGIAERTVHAKIVT